MTTSAPHPTTPPAATGLRAAARALPGPARLAALTLLLLPLGGLIAAGLSLRAPDPHHPVPVSARELASGETFKALERHLDANLPGRSALIGVVNTARYLTTRGGSDEVTLGRGGWLFLRSELAAHPQQAAHLRERADLIAELNARLTRRGVTLLVAVSPNKSRVQAAQLPGGALPAWTTNTYADFQALLRERGVRSADLLTPMARAATRGAQYYRTDTHWNQDGARTAAQATARAIRALAPDLPPATFTTAAQPVQARPGDLLNLMGLQFTPDALRPAADTEATETTVAAGDLGGGLLGAAPQVMLAGSSYGLRGNFHGALQQALGSAVLNVSREGADFSGSLRSALRDPAFPAAPPRVLVWEIPERFLPLPLAEEDRHPLAP